MRKFTLYNSNGASLDLSASEHYLSNPQGLGFEYDREYSLVGYQFNLVKESIEQAKPSATMKFNTYKEYRDFALFIQSKPLILEYIPDEYATFRMSVNVKSMTKTEKEEGNWLSCGITFESLGQWYKYIVMDTSKVSNLGKKYNYTYSFSYADNAIGSIGCTVESNIESPCRITFIGAVKNPSYSHYINGKLVAQGKINANVPEGHRLVISSVVPYEITETDSIGTKIQDRYGNSDFSTERFLYLGQGENLISFTHEGAGNLKAVVEAYEYYETV